VTVAELDVAQRWCQVCKSDAKTDAQVVKLQLISTNFLIYPGAGAQGSTMLLHQWQVRS
jgi:hypothetical protein